MKPDGMKIGQPGIHRGRIFKRLHIGYSPTFGQRFFVALSPLLNDTKFSVQLQPRITVCAPVTLPTHIKTEGGSAAMVAAYNASHG